MPFGLFQKCLYFILLNDSGQLISKSQYKQSAVEQKSKSNKRKTKQINTPTRKEKPILYDHLGGGKGE